MVNPQMVMYEEEFNQIQVVVDRLVRDANAKVVFIVDKNGQLIAAAGGDLDSVDTTSLASLTAGNIAGLMCYAALFGLFFVMPFIFVRAYRDSTFAAGLRLTIVPTMLGAALKTSANSTCLKTK